ncbi:Kiwa anti-phage protein KwaB-like domain-containing protein [Tissierellaceae bacterium HCP3S3_D8]
MSYALIKEGLEKVNTINSWSLALIKYNHKSRPNEYTCYSLRFGSDSLLKTTLNDMCKKFLYIVNDHGQKVECYSGANPKKVVDKLNINHELIKVPWNALIKSLNNVDDNTDLKDIKSNAFIFVGTYQYDGKEHNLYLISRKNPIYTYKKNRGKIFESRHNCIQEISEPLIQFGKSFDALIYNEVLYTINSNFESIFNLEYSHRIVCKKSLEIIEDANVIYDFETYKAFTLSGQHPRKFSTFDQRIVDNIKQEDNLKILVDELKIPYNAKKQKFDLSQENHADLFTKAICGKTKYNMFTGGVCEVPNSTPLNLS